MENLVFLPTYEVNIIRFYKNTEIDYKIEV